LELGIEKKNSVVKETNQAHLMMGKEVKEELD